MHPLVYAFAVSLLTHPSAERVRALQEATLLADGFRSVAGVPRLPSEALLASDPEAGVVVRIRGDGSRSTIRFDQGSTPGGIYPLSDRSWAVVDRSGERYFEIDPSGSRQTSERMLPATPGVLRVGSSDDPIQVDGEGRILRGGGLSRGGRPMVLEAFKGSQSRPLAQLAADPFATVGAGGIRATVKVPFQTGDRWAVGVDGRVGIVRVDPHRVDWWTDDGGLREGSPSPGRLSGSLRRIECPGTPRFAQLGDTHFCAPDQAVFRSPPWPGESRAGCRSRPSISRSR